MKFFIKKLGCPKNDVDGDYIAGILIDRGHQLATDDSSADVVIVNTCGFILPAKEESIETILYYANHKNEGEIGRLYVAGCLAQRYGDELVKELKEVDGFFGLGQIEQLIDAVTEPAADDAVVSRVSADRLTYLAGDRRHVGDKFPYDYLKIADGCDRFCAYCAIPHIRGRYRSRPLEDIVKEARLLASRGKKEIILVSQEGTAYGRDFDNGTDIIRLLGELEKVDGIEWIRLMYLHPESMTDGLIEYMSFSGKTLGYFDVPLQHISDKILAAMNRRVTRKEIEKILSKIRLASPGNIIRTTFIAGLPGETEEEFLELRDFIEDFEFDRLGVFEYSPEEDTKAIDFDDQVPDKVAAERQDILMNLQQEVAFKKNIGLIHKARKVIIDEARAGSPAIGRTEGDCPEIDQQVYVKGGKPAVGDIADVEIVMADGYDLIGVLKG